MAKRSFSRSLWPRAIAMLPVLTLHWGSVACDQDEHSRKGSGGGSQQPAAADGQGATGTGVVVNQGTGTGGGDTTPTALDRGIALYAKNCAGCHQPLEKTTKANRSASAIANAISALDEMKSLKHLVQRDLDDLATALATPSDGGGPKEPEPLDGPALYAQHCAGCHGELAKSTKLMRTSAAIRAAIDNELAMQGLRSLDAVALDKISKALERSAGPDPVDRFGKGSALYARNCAGCHGELERSTKRGRSLAQLESSIQSVERMAGLKALTASDRELIVLVLNDPQVLGAGLVAPRLATRKVLSSRLLRIFGNGADTAYQQALAAIVIDEITRRFVLFGGACSRQDQSCPGSPALNSANGITAEPLPDPMRRGHLLRACEKILSTDDAVRRALTRAGLTDRTTVDAANVGLILTWFLPDSSVNADVVTALVSLGRKSADASGAGLNAWRMVMLPICSSNQMESL